MSRLSGARWIDPRMYQIVVLSGLLLYGIVVLDFDINLWQALAIFATAQATQFACVKLWKVDKFDPRSSLISTLSLILLLRTNFIWIAAAAALVTIASKFVIRWKGKHFFNPTNLGIVAMMLTGTAWVSPGQWGSVAFFGFLIACVGGLVVNRASRSDITYAFLIFYLAILFGRSLWLGEPMTIPFHRVQNGAFLIFTFFMISDPRTTPDSRAGRILFAFLVAVGAGFVHFVMFRNNGLIWSLAAFACLTPVINWLLPGEQYQWSQNKPKEPAALQPLGAELTEDVAKEAA